MRNITPFTIVTLLLLLSTVAANQDGAASPIAGVYRATGTNGDGSAYRAIVIIREHENAFRLEWIFPSRRVVTGLGIRDGDRLAVSYFGSQPGVALYEVEGRRLVGRWTIIGGDGSVAVETLTLLEGHPVPEEQEHPAPEPARQPQRRPALTL